MKLPPITQVSIRVVRGVSLFPTIQGYIKRESSYSSIREHIILASFLGARSRAAFLEQSSFLDP
jgi:hypothetical protein